MSRRHERPRILFRGPARPCASLLPRATTLADLRADLMAGLVVGVVALPLSMALAIASGVPPQHGLYTAIVGGRDHRHSSAARGSRSRARPPRSW